jgi:hypothetical protein
MLAAMAKVRGVLVAASAALLVGCSEDEKPPAFADPNDAVLRSVPDEALHSDTRRAKSLTGNDFIDVCTRLHWKLAYSRHLACVEQWWLQRADGGPPALAPAECRSFVSNCEGGDPGDEGGSHGWYEAAECNESSSSQLFTRCAESVTVADIAKCLSERAIADEKLYDTLSCEADASWLFDKSISPACQAYATCW